VAFPDPVSTGLATARAPRSRLDSPLAQCALALGYALAFLLLLRASNGLWYLAAGLRLGALWLSPSRRWGWLAVADWTALTVVSLLNGWPIVAGAYIGMTLMPWLIYAGIVRLLRGPLPEADLDVPRHMALLLGSGIAAAALVSPVLQAFMTRGASSLAGVFAFMYGDILGLLVIAPLMALAWSGDRARLRQAPLWVDLAALLALSMVVLWLIAQRQELAPYLLLLAFAPIFLVAFRRGWEGAALAVALVGLLVEEAWRLGLLAVDVRALQLALTVVGGGGLVLGAASTQLRRGNERLAQRHRELGEANRSLTQAANELRSVSQRLVRLEEQGQRELANELEEEIGRSIHALSTRISLAFRDVRDEQMLRLLESVREQVRELQESLRRVLRQLRPQALDTHGLREAIDFGPLRDMAEEAGLGYECQFAGAIGDLRDDAQTTVYRICQAAVREATRTPSVRRVLVRLEVAPCGQGALEVTLQVDLEGAAPGDVALASSPLPAINDRVVAHLGGYWLEPLSPGVRHKVRFAEA
jgi:glucose-6-phosphate-specific signal transduction histidine kinase